MAEKQAKKVSWSIVLISKHNMITPLINLVKEGDKRI